MPSTIIKLDLRGVPIVRQFVWELRRLESDMRVGADPFAERLTNILDRFGRGEEGDLPDGTKDQD